MTTGDSPRIPGEQYRAGCNTPRIMGDGDTIGFYQVLPIKETPDSITSVWDYIAELNGNDTRPSCPTCNTSGFTISNGQTRWICGQCGKQWGKYKIKRGV